MLSMTRFAKTIGTLFAGLLVIVSLLDLQGCAKKPSSQVNIRLKWLNQAQFAGFYYAKEAGIYAEKGLTVTLHPGGIDYPAIQMVASGSDHFGVTGADQILIAREKGIPVVAIACIYRKSPFVLFALKESTIQRVEDFPGKKIGIKLGGNEELTYRAMMNAAGISSTLVQEIPIKFDITPLLSKQVDVWPGYSINEPITAEEKGFPVNLIWPSDYGIHLYADVLFTTEEMLRTQPEIVKAVVQATLEGWSKAFANKDSAVTYTLRYGKELTKDHETRMLNASEPLVKPDDKPIGYMELSVWKEMHSLLRESNFLKSDVDVSKSFRIDFVEGAKK
jgi:ABC-type nitrate/sulfonate/bicarbonate transport system substrate-binding protein